ncbi:transposase [Candidatus Peregrinibacteria bacterium]|nr:MAG: transposase [Candidatus Peregrinibacteria bacterium]
MQRKRHNSSRSSKGKMKFPWEYNKNIYAYRNEIERLFHRMKNHRRISTRYDKLDLMYASFISLCLVALLLKVLC